MKIIISPAKKMNINTDEPFETTVPVFIKEADTLRNRLKELDLYSNVTPAVLSYEGIQYQYMAPQVFSAEQWDYVREHLRILSGLYGVLRPMDGVIPYRLEMQAKLKMGSTQDLYAFWGDRIYRELAEGEDFLLNLASIEYSRAAEKYIDRKTRFVTCVFGELSDGKVKVKGTMAKMARGEMVRWLSEKNITEPDEMKEFTGLGYGFDAARSTDKELVFLK